MSSDRSNQFHSQNYPNSNGGYGSRQPAGFNNAPAPSPRPNTSNSPFTSTPAQTTPAVTTAPPEPAPTPAPPPVQETPSKLALELEKFNTVASTVRSTLVKAPDFQGRCQQAFDLANELFGNAPTWVCFYRELMGGNGLIHSLFDNNTDFGAFLRTEQYHQIQMMLTALRSRDLPENDPNDPQRMITVRLPKSLHEAMCDEAGRLNISVNRLCISRMLQLLDPKMIPETNSKPRGRKPRSRQQQNG